MKNSLSDTIYIVLCLAVLLIPLGGMLIFGEAQPAANEVLASRPALRTADGGFNTEVLSDTQDYIADRFFLPQECATAWAGLNAALLRTSVEEKVILGSDGWLYYGETAGDYMGLGLSDAQLTAAARNLALMQEYVRGRGAQFVFTIAPNKNSIYPEHMPAYIPAGSGTSNRERLPALLEAAGVNYVDLFAPLREFDGVIQPGVGPPFNAADIEDSLYYHTDSHWTNHGAALAADTLLRSLGCESDWCNAAFLATSGHSGDLYHMLYPTGSKRDRESVYAVLEGNTAHGPAFAHTTDGDPNFGDAINIRTHAEAQGALLCFRDSFGRALYPYLADSFAEALFTRQSAYDLTRMDEINADTVIIELVERNIKNLITEAPVFPAPERAAADAIEADGSVAIFSEAGSTAGTAALRRWYGELEADAGAPVYLMCSGRWYECCLLDGGNGGAGFSAWLPSDGGAPERVAFSSGGEAVSFSCISAE